MTEPPVLVTGGSGVVGRAIVRRLVDSGRGVRALARSDVAAATVRGLGAAPVFGDVLDQESVMRAMDGCEVVYHVAGLNQFCLRDPAPLFSVNVTGSVNCVEAAAATGIRRVVYTSSAVTVGEEHGTVGSEESRHRGSFLSSYERSKFEAEQAVLRGAERLGVDVVYLNPSSAQGPGRTSGTGQVLMAYLRGNLKFWAGRAVSLVDLDDCAAGHLLAEEKGEPGRRYLLSAASLDSDELVRIMARIAPGVPPPRLVPAPLVKAVVRLVELAARVQRRTPLVCRESLRTLLHGHRYDGSRAERELGLHYRPVEETLERTARWLVAEGLAPTTALG